MIPLHLNFCKSIPDRALTLLLAASFCSPDCHDFLPCLFQFLHYTQFLLIKNFVKSWLVLFFSFRPCLHSFCCFRFLNWISSLCSLTLLTRAPKFAVILWAPKTASLEVLLYIYTALLKRNGPLITNPYVNEVIFEKAKTTFKMLLATWFLVCFFKRFRSLVANNLKSVD